MNKALAAGAAGMAAQQVVLDTIAVNLANSDVPGYRANRAEFAPLITPQGLTVGIAGDDARKLFTQGRLESTGRDEDLAVDGGGFFEVLNRSGRSAFTRAGNFSADASGHLRLPNGAMLAGIRLPAGTTSFSVAADGRFSARVAGKNETVAAGRVTLCAFTNEAGLRTGPDGLFYATVSSGNISRGRPAWAGLGSIKQRFLELGNINVIAGMMAVLGAQRIYEANAKCVQAADEMLRLANNLER